MRKLLTIISLMTICLIPFEGQARTVKYLTFEERVHKGAVSLPRRPIPKKAERKSRDRANIIITFNESMPDSIRTAILIAKDMWEAKIPATQPICIDASYEPLDNATVMLTEVGYAFDDPELSGCPMALAAQITGQTSADSGTADGYIAFNSDSQWNCSFADNGASGYNVTTMALRGIAICLGFGSSICEVEPDMFEFFNACPSYFDKLLMSNGISLSSLEERSTAMKTFITSRQVTLKTKSSTYNVYAPTEYEPYTSLVYLSDKNTLMSREIGEGSLWQSIDDGTVDILRTIGWNINSTGYPIVCNDISGNGIGSAYAPHTFSLSSGDEVVTSYKWHFSLKGPDGRYVNIKNGYTKGFIVDKINMPQSYYVNPDGDLEGMIECEYEVNGKTYNAQPFHVSLELKPMIISIDNKQKFPGNFDFHMQFDVKYAGADRILVELEEEDNTSLRTQYYYEPYIAHVTTGKLTTLSYTWITIIVSNKYGSVSETLEFEPEFYTMRNKASLMRAAKTADTSGGIGEIRIYTPDGKLQFHGSESDFANAHIPSGLYIKRTRYNNGSIHSTKTMLP